MRGCRRPTDAAAVLWATATALILSYLVAFGLSAAARLPRPVEFMYGESIVLELAGRVARGEPLYPAPDRLPLTVTAYTPVYYLLVGGLQRPFGEGYAAGRTVSLAATLGAAALLAWGVRRAGGGWAGGLLAGGLFLTQNLTSTFWAVLHRVDMLALCLTLLGLGFAAAGRPKAAAPLLVLAVMTKQTYLAGPAAVTLALWPDRRAMLGFGSLFAAGLAAAAVAAQALSGGWFLWHTVVANATPYDGEYLSAMLGQFLHLSGLPLLAAAAHFTLPARPGERLWRLYFLVALLALPTFGKMGASSNYWLELTAASAALIGLLAGRLAARPAERGAITELGLAMMVVGALLAALPGYQATVRESLQVLPSGGVGTIRAQVELAPLLAAEPGELLTDEPALAVAAGRPIAFEFQIFQLLAQMGLWDERPILEAIAARRFALAVFTRPLDARGEEVRWSAAVLDALRAEYEPAGQQSGYWLYRPHGAESERARERESESRNRLKQALGGSVDTCELEPAAWKGHLSLSRSRSPALTLPAAPRSRPARRPARWPPPGTADRSRPGASGPGPAHPRSRRGQPG